jgi:uncharacterized membrane protein affecting hemolysin expression
MRYQELYSFVIISVEIDLLEIISVPNYILGYFRLTLDGHEFLDLSTVCISKNELV